MSDGSALRVVGALVLSVGSGVSVLAGGEVIVAGCVPEVGGRRILMRPSPPETEGDEGSGGSR